MFKMNLLMCFPDLQWVSALSLKSGNITQQYITFHCITFSSISPWLGIYITQYSTYAKSCCHLLGWCAAQTCRTDVIYTAGLFCPHRVKLWFTSYHDRRVCRENESMEGFEGVSRGVNSTFNSRSQGPGCQTDNRGRGSSGFMNLVPQTLLTAVKYCGH